MESAAEDTPPDPAVDVSKIRCFRCGKAGHVSCNCPTRPESGKGKGGEKGKSGLVKSDMSCGTRKVPKA